MRKRARLALLVSAIAIATIVISACPLPFEFTPKGSVNSGGGSNDPANPATTAPPELVIVESASGSPVDSTPATIVATQNIEVRFETETPSAVVFYTTDGSSPLPGSAGTTQFAPSSPIVFASNGAGATIKALAIGPNMYPSLVTTKTVSVAYPQAAAPTFTPPPRTYINDLSVTISSATAGASIYYTIVDGNGGAPAPVPGEPGTFLYTGAIPITTPGTVKSISAIAVKDEMLDSPPASGVFEIGFDKVVFLDGIDDYVAVPLGDHTYTTITIEVWINVPLYGGDAHYVSLGQNIVSALGSWEGGMQINAGALGLSSEISGDGGAGILPNTWQHFAYSYDGVNQYLLINGNVVATLPTTGAIAHDDANDFEMKIGARFDDLTQFTQGQLDEIRLWNIYRSPVEIAATMNAELTGSETGLVGYWNFDDGDARDRTGNGADGTLQGGAVIVLQ